MGRPRTYERADVLRRATDLFARKGYEGAHLQELVEVTGLNRFSLYKEFGGKEGLFEAALESYLEELNQLDTHLRRDPPGLANLRAFYAALVKRDLHDGCFAVNTVRERHVVPPAAFAKIERFLESAEAGFRRNLVAARELGELPRSTDVGALAKLLTALQLGLINFGIVKPDQPDRALMIALVEKLFA